MANTELQPERMVEVSEAWMHQLAELAEKVSKQMNDLEPKDHTVMMKLDVAALVGYASSARNIVKYRRIADRNTDGSSF